MEKNSTGKLRLQKTMDGPRPSKLAVAILMALSGSAPAVAGQWTLNVVPPEQPTDSNVSNTYLSDLSSGADGAPGEDAGNLFGTVYAGKGDDGVPGDPLNPAPYGSTDSTSWIAGTTSPINPPVLVTSIGGNGGNGGHASVKLFQHGYGGAGGNGGAGGSVVFTNNANLTLVVDEASRSDDLSALYVASIGGQGGNGGSASGDGTGIGGSGGYGGAAGSVTLTNYGNLYTGGQNSAGLLATSLGGGGGQGGDGEGWWSGTGGSGSASAPGGNVTVTNSGTITTGWASYTFTVDDQSGDLTTTPSRALGGPNSAGIAAQSIGGYAGSGGSGDGIVGYGGGSRSAGGGGTVSVTNSGTIMTGSADSPGILAQSVGGGGGSAGSGGGIVALGGAGDAGGDGGQVGVMNSGAITAAQSEGIFAQSVGGGGGSGGKSGGLVSVGGQGSRASNADVVTVINTGAIQSFSSAIFAQSVGGGGGKGGSTIGLVAVGGSGGGGGNGGGVSVASGVTLTGNTVPILPTSLVLANNASLITFDGNASAIFAQSVGGGGGSGGGAISGNLFGSAAVGGKGSQGGTGGDVNVVNGSSIVTAGDFSNGILAQSVGGGGGSGGSAVAASYSGTVSGSVAIGGAGAGGGNAGTVAVSNGASSINTFGEHANGIFAQSVGGGGGAGGHSIAGALGGGFDVSVALGGSGAGGGAGKAVTVDSLSGDIRTISAFSSGIFAQSVGGGGGAGGASIAATAGALASADFGLGGSGGGGGSGDTVTVTSNNSNIVTAGDNAFGILAQSVGGGGGAGGYSVSGNITSPNGFAATVTLGGTGSKGGNGGEVSVTTGNANDLLSADRAYIITSGGYASGILAQSVGGGGGAGGHSISAGISGPLTVGFSMGGAGAAGGDASAATVNSSNLYLHTTGNGSNGLVAQSVGGGGGAGGFSVTGSLSTSEGGGALSESFGGNGGNGGTAADASVTTAAAAILTEGDHASGIVAQSVGGGGGMGGFSGALAFAPTAGVAVDFGGLGGPGNAAGDVTVTAGLVHGFFYDRNGSRVTSDIATSGIQAHGIFAQSVGGGGGAGGASVALTAAGQVGIPNAISLTIGGSGGAGANAGEVTVTTLSNNGTQGPSLITTSGDHASGIFAQSVGGGGGHGAISFSAAASGFAFALPDIPVLKLGGKGGVGGEGNSVSVTNVASITTNGDFAPDIVAQSIGGGGGTGGVKISGDVSIDPETGVGVSLGATGVNGAPGADAGSVTVAGTSSSILQTNGGLNSPGILAQSVGGGGGTGGWSFAAGVKVLSAPEWGPALAPAFGGQGGAGGSGGEVSVSEIGNISTLGDNSQGVLAQSIGGGGGNGGFAIGISATNQSNKFGVGALTASFGGQGGSGATSGDVTVSTAQGSNQAVPYIQTQGNSSAGIFAQSVGGGGGNGGGSVAVSVQASDSEGTGSNFSIAHGGNGGAGGKSGDVTVTSYGIISTGAGFFSSPQVYGNDSPAILAQSIGGGGGNGGFSISSDVDIGSSNLAVGVSASMGGSGGSGNDSGDVTVSTIGGTTGIFTRGARSSGIFAQSVGGGGGSGGMSISANASTVNQLNLSMGGSAGGGGNAGSVTVSNEALIFIGQYSSLGIPQVTNTQDYSYGIHAQSIGGGGGSGGISVAGSITTQGMSGGGSANQSVGVSIGGEGGSAGSGNTVSITNAGSVLTGGNHASGILAQSVGGGGGAGGLSVAGTLAYANPDSRSFAVDVSIGGSGGAGGSAGDVTVSTQGPKSPYSQLYDDDSATPGEYYLGGGPNANTAVIGTAGTDSPGILAQSIAGGGGSGGIAVAAALNNLATLPISVFLGGSGGVGKASGDVTINDGSTLQSNGSVVSNAAGGYTEVHTSGDSSPGIVAQSITGGGGFSSNAFGGGINGAGTTTLRLGASNSSYNVDSGKVVVTSSSTLSTAGADSSGIIAQSIGAGGGVLHFSVEGTTDWPNGNLAIGGDNGNHDTIASSGSVTVTTAGTSITTTGDRSSAIVAQSIGGGGGLGSVSTGGAASGGGLAMQIGGGGDSSNWGNGSTVTVSNSSAVSVSGSNAHGIIAQSVGGGGGMGIYGSSQLPASVSVKNGGQTIGDGGNVTVTNIGAITTAAKGAYGIIAQSIGGGGGIADYVSSANGPATMVAASSVANGGAGSGNGTGGTVSVNQSGSITTSGAGAIGIFAQSVGGGGGLDIALGKALGGYGAGAGGEVNVTNSGTITTTGQGAHGIVAQSIGGNQQGGVVNVTAASNVTATGTGSYGILAQSDGLLLPWNGDGDDQTNDLNVTVNSQVVVTGGSGAGAGLALSGNGLFFVKNYGTITNASGVDGLAISSPISGEATIDNFGTVVGSIRFDSTTFPVFGKTFNNHANATVESGTVIDLDGDSETASFNNNGILSPLGTGRVGTTEIRGGNLYQGESLVYLSNGTTQTELPGSLAIDIDAQALTADQINVTIGAAYLHGGQVNPNYINATSLKPNNPLSVVILQAGDGFPSQNLTVQPSAVMSYALAIDNTGALLSLSATPDFSPTGLSANQQAIGNAINNLLSTGKTVGSDIASSNSLLNTLISAPNVQSLGKAYEQSLTSQALSYAGFTSTETSHAVMQSPMNRAQTMSTGGVGALNMAGANGLMPGLSLLAGSPSNLRLNVLDNPMPASQQQGRLGIWFEPFIRQAQNQTNPTNMFDSETFGASGGADYMYSDRLVAGFALGVMQSDVNHVDQSTSGDNTSKYLTVYGGYAADAIDMQVAFSYGKHRYDNVRKLSIGGATLLPTLSLEGESWAGALEIGKTMNWNSFAVRPFAKLSYNHVMVDGAKEQGAGGLEIQVAPQQIDSLITDFGIRVNKSFDVASGVLMPGIIASWKHEHTDGTFVVPTSLIGASDVTWSVENENSIENRGLLGIELQFVNKKGTAAMLSATTERWSGYRSYGLYGYLRKPF